MRETKSFLRGHVVELSIGGSKFLIEKNWTFKNISLRLICEIVDLKDFYPLLRVSICIAKFLS
jgi:hypothetical protein